MYILFYLFTKSKGRYFCPITYFIQFLIIISVTADANFKSSVASTLKKLEFSVQNQA